MGAITGPFLPFNISNSAIPPEGPRAVRIPLNFATVTAYEADLTTLTQGQPNVQMSYVQTLFVDNSTNDYALLIETSTTSQNIVIPPQSQGFVPILQPNNPKISFTSAGAGGTAEVFALNFPVSPAVWSANGPGTFYFSGQSLKVTDVILDALVGNYGGYGNAIAVADLGLQSLISGGALMVTGSTSGGVGTADLQFTANIGLGSNNNIIPAPSGGQSIVVTSLIFSTPADTYSSATTGDEIFVDFADQSSGNVFWEQSCVVPTGPLTVYGPGGGYRIANTGLNYELSAGAAMMTTQFTLKGSTITWPTFNPGINLKGTYFLK